MVVAMTVAMVGAMIVVMAKTTLRAPLPEAVSEAPRRGRGDGGDS